MKTVLLSFLLLFGASLSFSQDNVKVKLFIDMPLDDIEGLDKKQEERLFYKTVQAVNRVSVVEVGYSNFLIYPKFDIIDLQVSETGMQNIYVANCEYSLYISRRSYVNKKVRPLDAIYDSHTITIQGSGYTKQAAINNAINNIPLNDNSIKWFIVSVKDKIVDYFNVHCEDVLKEAEQAHKLRDYAKSISLYFSIPESAGKCYEDAKRMSIGVYKKYNADKCKKDLMLIKSSVAAVNNNIENKSTNRYDEVLKIIERLSPVDECYAEAVAMIEKLEHKFDEQEKIRWELDREKAKGNIEVQKEKYKAMGKINANYKPPSSPSLILINSSSK